MSALAASQVSLYPTGVTEESQFYVGGVSGRTFVTRRLLLSALSAQGSAANPLGAAALGFAKVIACSNLWDATNSVCYRATVDPVNNRVVIANLTTGAPFDLTTTAAYISVTGVV